jgi:uncharacterized Ntn-hydrolase superfamily protein
VVSKILNIKNMVEENDLENIRVTVDSIENTVRSLEKQKEVIQSNCTHKEEIHLAFDDKKSIKRYCSKCKKELGYASDEEQKTFLNK